MNRIFQKLMFPPLRHLQPWEHEYFRHLEAQWAVLNIDPAEPDAQRIAALCAEFEDENTRKQIRRSRLLEFEQTLLSKRSIVSLVQIAPVLRQRFHDVAGDRVFAAYRPTAMPDCAKADEKARKALCDDLSTVVAAIHWRYILFPFNSQIRTTLTLQTLCFMLLYTALWGIVVWMSAHRDHGAFLAVFITCLFAGVLGGFISALRRIQSIGDDCDAVYAIEGIRASSFWLWFSPMLGGMFAIIALLFFLSGVLSGSVFPSFHSPADFPCLANTMAGAAHCGYTSPPWWFWHNLLPIAQDDYAKLFLWCFIAGFAERFIPDMIDKLVARADPGRPSPPPSTPVTVPSGPPNPTSPVTPPVPPGFEDAPVEASASPGAAASDPGGTS